MSLIFQYRSTQLEAWFARQDTDYSFIQEGPSVPAPSVVPVGSEVGVFGGSFLDIAHSAGPGRGISYFGRRNFSDNPAMSILLRVVPRFSAPSGQYHYILNAVDPAGSPTRNGMEVYVAPDNRLGVYITDKNAAVVANYISTNPLTLVAGTAIDIMFAWDGTTGSGSFVVSVNGVQVDAYTPAGAMVADNRYVHSILLGEISGGPVCNFDVNEFVIWDSAQSVVYSPRSGFTSAPQFNGDFSSDPGISNVRQATAYYIDGVQLTGALDLPATSDVRQGVTYDGGAKTGLVDLPGVSSVRSGVTYDQTTKTGTLLSTDPGVANVRRSTSYAINSAAKVGAMFAPNPSTQRLLDKQPVKITAGEDVEFIARLRTKSDSTPLEASQFTEIVVKLLKADQTSLELKLSMQDIFVNIDDTTEIIIVLDAVRSALLNISDDAGTLEVITTDSTGAKVIYDYAGAVLVSAPALP